MIEFLFSLATSGITIAGMWQAGNNSRMAWKLGLLAQAFWLVFIILFEAWGLLPLNAALVFVYTRNLRKWSPKPTCKKCGTPLYDGLCQDETCPYYDWFQHEDFTED